MRALLTILVLAGLGYFVLRGCGYIGKHSDVPANAEGSKSATEIDDPTGSGSKNGTEVRNGPVAPAPAKTTLPAEMLAAAKRVAEGSPLGDKAAAVDALANESDAAVAAIARRLRAASGDKTADKWRALSGLAGDPSFDDDMRSQFAQRAVGTARDAVIATSSVRYHVEKGDSLDKIAKKLVKDKTASVTAGMLAWVNGLVAARIKPGMDLVVPTEKVRIVVSKSRYTVRAYLGSKGDDADGLIRDYRCAIGREDKTPIATFEIETKLVKPPWDDPSPGGKRLHYGDAGYPLGTRWLSFKAAEGRSGLGIHGTDDPGSIGTKASLGCIRLRNADVEELFELVPVGTVVEIRQ